jgi:hypothetical protein
MEETTIPAENALIMLGCPQVPIQTSAALYLARGLKKKGVAATVAGTQAARALLEVADPDRHYLGEMIDLDRCIEVVAGKERDFDLCFVFVHNDAGIAYTATMAAISRARLFAVLFGGETGALAGEMAEVECRTIVAKGSHNPLPLKRKLDEVLAWVALRN